MALRYVEHFDPADHGREDRAYADAMARVAERYPDDLDAATLYAEALFLLLSRPGTFDLASPAVARLVHVLEGDDPWLDRIQGLRANASTKSHAELDEAEELDEGNPDELAAQYRELAPRLRNLSVVGGCCGTDHRHIGAICAAWTS